MDTVWKITLNILDFTNEDLSYTWRQVACHFLSFFQEGITPWMGPNIHSIVYRYSVCCSLPVVCLLCFCLDGSSVTRTSLLTGGCLLSQWCCCLHGHICHGGCHLGGLFPVILLPLDCTSGGFELLNVWNISLCKPDVLSVRNTWHLCDKTSDLYIYIYIYIYYSITYSPISPHYHPLVLLSCYFIAALVSLIDVHHLWPCDGHRLSPNDISFLIIMRAECKINDCLVKKGISV